MFGLRKDLIVIMVLTGALGVVTTAEGKVKNHHSVKHVVVRNSTFPVYVDRGVDRNPGGDNLYFSDTKRPSYIVGPAWFQRWE